MALRLAYSPGTPPVWHGFARSEKVLGGNISILAADLVTGGQVGLFVAPKNFIIASMGLDTGALDTNGTPTLTASIGDAASTARFLNASTAFRAGSVTVPLLIGAKGYKFTADTPILLTFPAGAATAAAGTVTCFMHGYIDP